METKTRKRLRSDDNSFILQSKKHIDQKLIDIQDSNKMTEIYNKTVNMLFKGSKNYDKIIIKNEVKNIDQFSNIIVNGSGSIKYINKEISEIKIFKELRKSSCCNKPSLILSDCSNCNLRVCEHCGFSCMTSCGALLCSTCIMLFDCGTIEEPICARCSYMM